MNLLEELNQKFTNESTIIRNSVFIRINFCLSVKITLRDSVYYVSIHYPLFFTSYMFFLFYKKRVENIINQVDIIANERGLEVKHLTISL